MSIRFTIFMLLVLSLPINCFSSSITYTYDDLNRLHVINLENGESITYEYDQVGNIISKTISGTNAIITSSASLGGSISPSGLVSINKSGNATFTISPSAGYVIANVAVDGNPQGAITSYTFSNVITNHYIEAIFENDPVGCPNPPVMIARSTPVYFSTLHDAYNAASDGETIKAQIYLLQEDFLASRDIAVTIDGGYTCAYDANPGRTFLIGSTTLNKGSVTLQNFQLGY